MLRLRTLVVSLGCVLALHLPLRAQGLIQLTLEGAIDTPLGGTVEVDLDVMVTEGVKNVHVDVFLAPGTDAGTLAELVKQQLDETGAAAFVSDPFERRGVPPRADLFVARATRIALRLGQGLSGRVTLCANGPKLVRVRPADLEPGATTLALAISAWHPHTERRSQHALEHEIAADASAARVAAELFQHALHEGWTSERPEDEAWQPTKLSDGSRIVGFAASLRGRTDARLEIEL